MQASQNQEATKQPEKKPRPKSYHRMTRAEKIRYLLSEIPELEVKLADMRQARAILEQEEVFAKITELGGVEALVEFEAFIKQKRQGGGHGA